MAGGGHSQLFFLSKVTFIPTPLLCRLTEVIFFFFFNNLRDLPQKDVSIGLYIDALDTVVKEGLIDRIRCN